jgi:hypothetical protein
MPLPEDAKGRVHWFSPEPRKPEIRQRCNAWAIEPIFRQFRKTLVRTRQTNEFALPGTDSASKDLGIGA